MEQEILSSDSICMLIGKLIVQHHIQVENLGKAIAQSQKSVNDLREENTKLRAEISRLGRKDDANGARKDSP